MVDLVAVPVAFHPPAAIRIELPFLDAREHEALALVGAGGTELPADVLPDLPTAPENTKNAFVVSSEFWADHDEELTERFNAWLAK